MTVTVVCPGTQFKKVSAVAAYSTLKGCCISHWIHKTLVLLHSLCRLPITSGTPPTNSDFHS